MRLIDAEALKKAIHSYENRKLPLDTVIDNAPTVDINTELSVAYLKGRRQGQSEERPQGEWIKDGLGGIGSYRCSLCGRVICTSITNNKPYKDYPFCHCGADMRKGEEE